jgi:hypothetical protein
LVGKYGRNKCSGRALLGMTFDIVVEANTLRPLLQPLSRVEVNTQQQRRRVKVTVRIDEESEVSTWGSPSSTAVPTYRLVWHDVSAATAVLGTKVKEGDSICPRREAWMESWQIPSKNTKIEIRNKWKEATDHLLIVQGETYRHDGSLDAAGSEWFNIACAGTSVAKMRLLEFDPMRSTIPGARAERQATLKMLTGRYLAGEGEPSYTSAGMPLLWRHSDGRAFEGEPEPSRVRTNVIEAYWGVRGAVCVTHRRTWRKKESLSDGAGAIKDDAGAIKVAMPEATRMTDAEREEAVGRYYLPAESRSLSAVRATIPPCPDGRPPAAPWYWVTYPVDHVIHKR